MDIMVVTNTQFLGRTLALAINPEWACTNLLGAVEDEWENHVRY